MPLHYILNPTRRVLVQLGAMSRSIFKNDNSNIDTTKHAELISFLEQPILTLEESDGSVPFVGYGLNLNFATAHFVSLLLDIGELWALALALLAVVW